MDKVIITMICSLCLTGCAGYYSHFKQSPIEYNPTYTFDGEDRTIDLSQQSDNEDVGSEEIISFDQG
jgi:hypothetical protein